MNRKTLRIAFTVGVAFLTASGMVAADDAPRRIVILTVGPDPFFDAIEVGAQAAETELDLAELGYELDFERGDFTDSRQIEKLNDYAQEADVAAIAIAVYNPNSAAVTGAMRNLREAGVHVITLDGDVDTEEFRDARFAHIGMDQKALGRELGRAARELNPQARYALFAGSLSAQNAMQRMEGFGEGIGEFALEVERLEDGGDRTRARSNVESSLTRNDDLEMLVGVWAYNTPQIVNAVVSAGVGERVHVVGFDAATESLRQMEDGDVDALVAQNPYLMGYEAMRLMLALSEGDQATVDAMLPDYAQEDRRDSYLLPARVIVPDADSPITPELFDESTEFFELREFREWLDEHGLTIS